MPAWLVGQVHVRDETLWDEYVAGVAASLVPHAAEVTFRGHRVRNLAGSQPRERVVVIRFADMQTLERWHDGDAYQALVSLRERAADVLITAYEAADG